jgi:hypothetical protein
MKQIVNILKKNKQILFSCICLFTLGSCYKIEPLPDRIKSDYEFAIPIIDTTITVKDFIPIKYLSDYQAEVPEGIPINTPEMSYPFYIGDYVASQEVQWIEPHIIIDAKDFPANTTLNISIYTVEDYITKYYFWQNHPVTQASTPVKIPEDPNRITDIEPFRSSRKVYMNMSVIYPKSMSVSDILQDKLNIKFSIKFAIKTDLAIKL